MAVAPDEITALICRHIPEAAVTITDPRGDGRQYVVHVTAPAFTHCDRLTQHRLVHAALQSRVADIEGLTIQTSLPAPARR